jgi:hypothetical protein
MMLCVKAYPLQTTGSSHKKSDFERSYGEEKRGRLKRGWDVGYIISSTCYVSGFLSFTSSSFFSKSLGVNDNVCAVFSKMATVKNMCGRRSCNGLSPRSHD